MIYWVLIIVVALVILISAYMSIYSIIVERKENEKRARKRGKSAEGRSRKNNISRRTDKDIIDIRESEPEKQPKLKKAHKRRWKIILEDMSSGEINDFIFVDAVGIGRTTQDVAYEEFLSIPEDKRISKVHCSITMIDDGLYIKDEGSRNHTYLNGKKVQEPVLLQKEDVISIGETDLQLVKIFREAER